MAALEEQNVELTEQNVELTEQNVELTSTSSTSSSSAAASTTSTTSTASGEEVDCDARTLQEIERIVGKSILASVPKQFIGLVDCAQCSNRGRRMSLLSPCLHQICTHCVDSEFDERPHENGLFSCPLCLVVVEDVVYNE